MLYSRKPKPLSAPKRKTPPKEAVSENTFHGVKYTPTELSENKYTAEDVTRILRLLLEDMHVTDLTNLPPVQTLFARFNLPALNRYVDDHLIVWGRKTKQSGGWVPRRILVLL